MRDTSLVCNSKYTSEWNTNLGYFQGEIIMYLQQFNQDKIRFIRYITEGTIRLNITETTYLCLQLQLTVEL